MNILFGIALVAGQVHSSLHEIVLIADRSFEKVRSLPLSLEQLNKVGPDEFCLKNKLRLVSNIEGSITVVPSSFAGLDFYDEATLVLDQLVEAKCVDKVASLKSMSEEGRKEIVDFLQTNNIGQPYQLSNDETVTMMFEHSVELSVGGRKVSLKLGAEDPDDRWKKVTDLQANHFVQKPTEPPPGWVPGSIPIVQHSPTSLEVFIVTERPVFTKERLAITFSATKAIAEFVDAQMSNNRIAVSKALAALVKSGKGALGEGLSPGGDVQSLPESTRNALQSQILGSWKALGFSSADDAASYWKRASVSGVKTEAFIAYGLATTVPGPCTGTILLGRK